MPNPVSLISLFSSLVFSSIKNLFKLKNRKMATPILTPSQVLGNYYLDTRWHLLETAAMLDRAQRGEAAHPEDESMKTDPRAQLLREALDVLASDSAEPNRTERLLMIFTKLDPKNEERKD